MKTITFIHHDLFIVFHLNKFMKSQDADSFLSHGLVQE